MSELICDNYVFLQVMSRFGISLGFGDRTVSEVCKMYNVDCDTFLSLVNYLGDENYSVNVKKISIKSLMAYLRYAHHYFLSFQLPSIRQKLLVFLDSPEKKELYSLVMNFFDAYMDEVRNHMSYEDEQVFPYVEHLLAHDKTPAFNFMKFAHSHDRVDTKLTELKDIIIKYLPTQGEHYHTNALLFEIFACIADLDTHSRIEDCIFIPAVVELQKKKEEE